MAKVNVRKRKDGRFETRIVVNGKAKSFYGASEAEARKKRSEYLKSQDRFGTVSTNRTLAKELHDYLFNYKQTQVKATTFDRAESIFRNHIESELIGRMQMAAINSRDIQKLINEKCRQGLSESAVKKIYNLLGEFYRYQIRTRVITYNPMEVVEMPHHSNFGKEEKEIDILEEDELKSVIVKARELDYNGLHKYRYGEAIILLLNTGLRAGELRAINIKDIDFEKKTLHIHCNETYYKDRVNGGIVHDVGEVKTKKSNRYVPLNDNSIAAINSLMSTTYNAETGYLICTKTGNIVTHNNLQKCYSAILKDAGVRHMGLHSTRHTFATMLLKKATTQGKIKEVSELLGHSDIRVTYKYYISTSNEDKRELVDSLSSLF